MKFTTLFITLTVSLSINAFALIPSSEYANTPAKAKMKYEEQKVQTSDGASLTTWYFPSSRITNKLIIVSHNGVGNMGDNLNRIKSLVSYGFNVLCFDYRGYGSSSGFTISDDTYIYNEFYQDFETVYDYAAENYGKRIYLYGWGIGATISITIGYTKSYTNTIIADGPISNYSDMPEKFKKIGSRMSVDSDVISQQPEPFQVLSSTPTPSFRGILLIVGSHDYLFTKSDMEALEAQVKSDSKEVFVLENKGSRDNHKHNAHVYMRKIHGFLVNY